MPCLLGVLCPRPVRRYVSIMNVPPLARLLIPRLPFFYGWVILACVSCAGLSRQGGAVAILSVFVAPMTQEFGWSRTALSGAVSLGGVLAAIASPILGRMLDRDGARKVLCLAILTTGLANLGLSFTGALPLFYLLFCIARMNFAGPFDLGIYGAVNNWFVSRRAFATGMATVGQMTGLVTLPLIAQMAMGNPATGGPADWRAGWFAVGTSVLVVGFVPVFLLMVRRPEDAGLIPDRRVHHVSAPPVEEPAFTRSQALRTRAFWLLSLFTLLAFPVQAGVSLHQAPFLIERGLSPTVAATVVSFFSLMSGVASMAFGLAPSRIPVRFRLSLISLLLGAGTLLMLGIHAPPQAYLAAGLFGLGIGGLLMMLPLAWADYFGRRSFGAIRGIALSAQVLAQATGPLISGVLRDWTGGYEASLGCFAVLAGLSFAAALFARRP
jgi:MFS transporter, OFA family, oxalate/formate antiporter